LDRAGGDPAKAVASLRADHALCEQLARVVDPALMTTLPFTDATGADGIDRGNRIPAETLPMHAGGPAQGLTSPATTVADDPAQGLGAPGVTIGAGMNPSATATMAAALAAVDRRPLFATVGTLSDGPEKGMIGTVGTVSDGDDREATFTLGTPPSGPARFQVSRQHAQGGLGVVYVAVDSELNREVALKQIKDQHADDPVSRSRFLLEAEITGGLE